MSILTRDPRTSPVPALQNGDHLTREEFERRYQAMPWLKKAELIEGVVYMGSPVTLDWHGSPHADVMAWLGVYRASTPGVRVGDNTSVRLDPSNEPQPDAIALIEFDRGGQAKVDEGYVEGGPELVVEVAASSVSIDRNKKKAAYLRNGIREYVLWRIEDGAIDWFVLRDGKYEPLPLVQGVYRSEVLPGLWLDPQVMMRGNLAGVFAVLQQGLASTEHAAFVERLRNPPI